jgi:hypothetical protein
MRAKNIGWASLSAVTLCFTSMSAHAIPKAGTTTGGGGDGIGTTPTAPVKKGTVTNLGYYDQSTKAHPAYDLVPISGAHGPQKTAAPTACPSDPKAFSWSDTWESSGDYGNDTFGAGYDLMLDVFSHAGAGTDPSYAGSFVSARGLATLFGRDVTLVSVLDDVQIDGNVGFNGGSIAVLGQDIYQWSQKGTLAGTKSWTQSIFSASTTITLGPVPVTFSAGANGTFGYTYSMVDSGNTITGKFEPTAGLNAVVSASVSLVFASAGVEGQLNLVHFDMPSTAVVTLLPTDFSYKVDADLTITSLSGEVDAFATLLGDKWTLTLASWSPLLSATIPLIHTNNCTNTLPQTKCGDGVCGGNESYSNCAADCPQPLPVTSGPVISDNGPPTFCQLHPTRCPSPISGTW